MYCSPGDWPTAPVGWGHAQGGGCEAVWPIAEGQEESQAGYLFYTPGNNAEHNGVVVSCLYSVQSTKS